MTYLLYNLSFNLSFNPLTFLLVCIYFSVWADMCEFIGECVRACVFIFICL